QRRRPLLTSFMTLRKITAEGGWKPPALAQSFAPAIGDRREVRVDRLAQRLDDLRQRILQVFVLAPAKGVALHDNPAAKRLLAIIECREPAALFGRQECRNGRVSPLVERRLGLPPVDHG